MITEAFLNLVKTILNGILDLLDVLPEFPETLTSSLDQFFDLIFSNLGLLSFFVRIETIKIMVPILIVVMNFEHLYRFIMWIVRKIPMVNIK